MIKKSKYKDPDYNKKYSKNNPKASTSYTLEDQEAINNVKKRDKNTCQWFNCGLTHRQAEIHVHHIFPRSKYPELELIEQYMICYCAFHHGLWHKYRRDQYANLILSHSHKDNLKESIEKIKSEHPKLFRKTKT